MPVNIVLRIVGWIWLMDHVNFVSSTGQIVNIVGTRKAQYKEFPYSVVFISRSSNKPVSMGSVITGDKILSAAHSFYQLKDGAQVQIAANRLYAVGGSRFTTANEIGYEKRSLNSIKSHPDIKWLEHTVLNDIAVVYLFEPFKINDYVKPLSVFSTSTDVFKKKWYSLGESKIECDGLRFGVVSSTSNISFVNNNAFLKATRVRFLPQEDCQKLYPEIGEEFRKGYIYCVTSKYSNESMCVGDPGSSLQCEGNVYAIFIKSKGCGEHTQPALYLSLENYIIMFGLSGQNNILNSFIITFLSLLVSMCF
ncbi:anionic trypsin-2-like [Cimex lectularius]|uniref:Peptidase S1 domain-containing protein n=1 Tax=Cimex lectularius TaxID=79782 RepID=A0A8I6RJY5_CIMLE|nr:anionic trypsin-2-like [Cimex lectularius]